MAGIYTLLKRDHDQLKPMLADLALGHERHLDEVVAELKAHSEAEEMVFYAPLEADGETRDLIEEGKKEHRQAQSLAEQLYGMRGNWELFAGAAASLREALLHHIDEEEGKLFNKARKRFSDEEARSLGVHFERQKQQIVAGMGGGPSRPVVAEETEMGPQTKASWPGR